MSTRNGKTVNSSSYRGSEVGKSALSEFPIVGLGASAGGLEAFEQFFRRIPARSGMAFVLVQHLDPAHVSILTTILQRSTAMPVVEAEDKMKVEPNSVYVIPPNRDMTVLHGVLQLVIPKDPHGHRMPIDIFMRSLAEDQGEFAIGVILSGTGTDGTQGLRAILGAGGITYVQKPETAKYGGMPSSAILSGFATYVSPIEDLPGILLSGIRTLEINKEEPPAPSSADNMSRILTLLRLGTGHDFSCYKKSTIRRRIARRMSLHNIDDLGVYARYMKEHSTEAHLLFKELLINVTNFFRDAEAFAVLKADIIPQLFESKPADFVLRVWVAGCATGEEAYSIAILLREHMEETRQQFKIQIYGTDLDEDAIVIARSGIFPLNIAQDISRERLQRFFVKQDSGYQIKKEIRELVIFAVQNVIKDPPFTKLDLLCCRNLMIYLEPELQNLLIPRFHYSLKPGGILFLSSSECIGNHTELFAPLDRKWRIYRAIRSTTSLRPMFGNGLPYATYIDRHAPEKTLKSAKETNFAELTKRALLQCYAPASVVIDLQGNIHYVYGDTGKYLRPAPGNASLNVIDMAREGLQLELHRAILDAAGKGIYTFSRELSVKTNGNVELVNVNLRPLTGAEGPVGLLLLSFQPLPHAKGRKRGGSKYKAGSIEIQRIEELERELNHTKENLQAIIEEQQSSNEDLKSTNEEMQSTNEELQSTNEELETSKEELQSVNEELITVNTELQAKIEQLADMQNDMKNLLDNINIGIVFLDQHLAIRRFTREAAKVYRLVSSDVGRSLFDIKSDLEGEDLLPKAQTVLETLIPCELEVRTASGAWYLARIQPYRTLDNVIEGVVMTFTDISKRIEAEIAQQEARELAEGIVDTVREPLLVLDGSLKVVSASRYFYQYFRVTALETVGQLIYELKNHQWDIPRLRELLERVLPQNESFESYAVEYELPGSETQTMLLNARRITGKKSEVNLILLAIEICTVEKR